MTAALMLSPSYYAYSASDNIANAKQLYEASENGSDQEVLQLLQKGAPPNNSGYYTREKNGRTPLHTACAQNNLRKAKLLIKFGAMVGATDIDGWTPLHEACHYNCEDTAKLVLEHHCPTGIKDIGGCIAAVVARQWGNLALADYVDQFQPRPRDPLSSYPTLDQLSRLECDRWLQLGVRLGLDNDQLESIKKSQHSTAATLHAAKIKDIDIQWKDIVEALGSIGEYMLAESVCTQQGTVHKAGETPLSLACANGDSDTVKYLVDKHHCNPRSSVNKAGDTPLSLACANGHLETVKCLVNEYHCDPRSTANKAGRTPLFLAIKHGHRDVVIYLAQDHQCDPKFTVNKDGHTPLSLECSLGNLEMVKALINKHIDPTDPVNKAGDTPLSLACANGHLETVKYLVNEHHCDPKNTIVNKTGDTPLSMACANGHLDTVKYLVNEHHCDPRSTANMAGETPLSLAYKNKHLETIKYLAQEQQCYPKFTVNEAGDTPLSRECSLGNLEIIKALINKHVDPKKPVNKAGDTPLSLACANGHLDTVKYLVNELDCDPLCRTSAGDSPISLACANGHLYTVKYLVNEYKCDPSCSINKAGETSLSLACANGHLNTVKYLVNKHHCDPMSSINKAGETPLFLACANGHLNTVKYLVNEHRGDPKYKINKAGDTPLSLACANGHLDTVKYLVNEQYCDPRSTANKAGWTPLSLAYKHRRLETIKYLAQEHQCYPKFPVNKAGDTPLSHECSLGNLEMVKALINKHVDPKRPANKAGDTPLSLACANGHLNIVKYLVNKHNCDPRSTANKADRTPLFLAYKRGHWEVVIYLAQEHQCDPKFTVNKAGDTPLSCECSLGHLEMVKALINKHVDPKKPVNKAGDTPLSLACANGHLDTVKYLVNEHHCDPRSTANKACRTPLSLAYKSRHWDVVIYLAQDHQCDPKFAVNDAGDTPLSIECSLGNLELVKVLINKHINPKKPVNKAGDTPLSLVCVNGHLDTVKYLVNEHHCDPRRSVNKAGDTPLSLACANGHLKTVKYLVNEHHCNPRSTANKAGWTPLYLAYKHRHREMVIYLAQEQQCDPNFFVNAAGDTPLSHECSLGNLNMVKALINKHVDPKKPVNKAGDTPLSLACAKGHLDTIKFLVNKCHCDPKSTVNKAGETPLFLAYKRRHWEVVIYLAQEHQCDPKFALNEAGDTPLSLACSHGTLKMVMALINSHVDPKGPVNNAGDTPLSLAYKGGHWEVVKHLAITHHCETKDVLLLAVKHDQKTGVEILLAECHNNPNVTDEEGKTLLDLAKDPEIIKLLLKHGAKAANVYKEHSKLIGKLSSERPPHLPLSVLIIGDGGVGKSTLLKSLLSSKGFWSKLQKAKPVDGVDARTVGIIPHEVYSKEFGRIIYFDFAGQKEFYTSHCAILENAVQTSPPIIILCVKLVENEQAIIIDSMYRWLTLVQNQCSNLKGKAHVIVVGSHADQVKELEEDPRAKEGVFTHIIKQFPKFEFTGFIPMDCRFADSGDMNIVRKQIQKSSAVLRSPETISLNAHTFYIYLVENFKDYPAISLREIQQRIHRDLDRTHESKKMADILSFIPTTLTRLVEICDQLCQKGLLLFLRNKFSPENSFLICDSKKLLSDVTGTVFAPEQFYQHCDLASSTGVVPLSKFSEAFSNYDIEMLIAFMTHLEFCFEIKDKQVLNYIQKMEHNLDDTRYLFFPGLIRIETPVHVWEEDPSMSYNFGWIIECAKDIQFFDSRSFQILILRLVFTFCLAPSEKINTINPALQRFCSVWKSGICWCNDDGITTYLELSNNKYFSLKIRSEVLTPESLAHRSKIINKILETVRDVCPNIVVVESIIDPQEVVSYPLKPSSELSLFSVRDLAVAVTSLKHVVKSVHRALSIERLLQFELYAGLDIKTLRCVLNDTNVKKDDKISNAFISHFASQISDPNSICMYRRILSLSQGLVVKIQSVSPRQKMVQALETWRSETEGTYSCLRETLSKYSVFSGRNPLDLAGAAHDDIDLPDDLPDDDIDLPDDDIDLPVFIISDGDDQMDPGTTSHYDLMVKHGVTGEQIDREIEQDDLALVAMHFDDVELYLNPLKLTDNEQVDVRRETYISRSNQVAVIICLSIWRSHKPSEATFRALIKILLELKKEKIASKICQYLKEKEVRHACTNHYKFSVCENPETYSSSVHEVQAHAVIN